MSTKSRRFAGVAGLCGALLFFAGDMLFYGHWGSGAGFHEGMIETVRNASLARLYAGGLLGPVAACLCIVGFWHVYLNVRPAQARTGQVMLVAFVVLMIFGSAIHTLWTTRALAIKYCYYNDDAGCHALVNAVNSYWSLAYNLGAAPGYLGAILLLGWCCWERRGTRGGRRLRIPPCWLCFRRWRIGRPLRSVLYCQEDSQTYRSQCFSWFRIVQRGSGRTKNLPSEPDWDATLARLFLT